MRRLTRLLLLALPVLLLSCDDTGVVEPLAPSADVTADGRPVASQWVLSPYQDFTSPLMCKSPYNWGTWHYLCTWTYNPSTHTFTGQYYDVGGSFRISARVTDGAGSYATSGSVKLYLCRASVRGQILPKSNCTIKGGAGRWVTETTRTMPSSSYFEVTYNLTTARAAFCRGYKIKYNGKGSGFKSTSIAFDFCLSEAP